MPDAAAAREQAREILAGRRYQDTDVPRPFKEPLRWLGDRVEDVGDWFARRFDDIDGALPGGGLVVWLLLAALVVALAAALSRSAIRRRVAPRGAPPEAGPAAEDPALLEREAEAAERAGDWERAVRLRFRAGALRLRASSKTTGEIAASVGSPRFERFAGDYDAIAYGGRPAEEPDAREAREAWEEALR